MTSSNGKNFRVTGPGEFPAQRPVTPSFDACFDLRLNKRLSKQPWGWWFETPSWSLWRQCNDGTNPTINSKHAKYVRPITWFCYHFDIWTEHGSYSNIMFSIYINTHVHERLIQHSCVAWRHGMHTLSASMEICQGNHQSQRTTMLRFGGLLLLLLLLVWTSGWTIE